MIMPNKYRHIKENAQSYIGQIMPVIFIHPMPQYHSFDHVYEKLCPPEKKLHFRKLKFPILSYNELVIQRFR